MSELNDFLKLISEAKAQDPKHQKIKEIKETVREDVNDFFAQLASASPKHFEIEKEEIDELVEKIEAIEQIEQDIIQEEIPEIKSEADKQAEVLSLLKKQPDAVPFSQPNPEPTSKDIKAITDKIKFMEQWLGKITATGPGSGEVNFRYLDDVERSTMTSGNDNWVLEYDAASKKVQFTKDIGPIDSVQFDVTHEDDNTHGEGTLTWNNFDRTLNLHHKNSVRQQIGQEQYYPPVKNITGSTITNGTLVMFAGAESDNNARLLITPMIANGTYPSLYVMGITTEDIVNGETGFVTAFGYVNDVDTSMWEEGDILYANPLVPGGLTNIKPTAPNNVIPVAAVVHKDAVIGRIIVRPTVEQEMQYARFSSEIDQHPLTVDTAYPITFGVTDISRGFHADGETIPDYSKIYTEESGFFKFDVTISLTSTNAAAKAFYVWMRKNGVDIPRSAKRQSITGNGVYQLLAYTLSVSLAKDDYIQIMYAASDTAIIIDAPDVTAFSPAIPSATITCTQIAL